MQLKKTDEDKAEGKTDHLVIWAGVGVRHIKDIKGASMSPTLLNP
jgi:nitronate monooxygenase